MAPGRALDVGAGEGGDAIWLAQRGWHVVASDVSANGLDRVLAAGRQHAVEVDVLLERLPNLQLVATDPPNGAVLRRCERLEATWSV